MEVSLKRRPSELRRVAGILREREIDVIHTHNSSAHFFGALLSLFYRFPRVATSHATFFQPHWRLCDRIIAPSENTARYQHRVNLMPRGRIDVIPNFINVARLRPERGREEIRQELGAGGQALVILSTGELIPRKNQELLLRALPALIAAGLTPLVLLAGKQEQAYHRQLTALTDSAGLSRSVRFLGERRDIPDLLAAADCFCLPSRHEILPIALLEAMATRLPIVATRVGGVAELVRDGIDGFVTPSGDAAALASALTSLGRDAGLRTRMGEAGSERIRSTYTPEACVPRILESYQLALARKGRAGGTAGT